MSAGAALQVAIVDLLINDPAVALLLGNRIYDNAPADVSYPYLSFGPAQELEDEAECVDGVECFQQLDIWTQEGGSQLSVKQICGVVRKVLRAGPLTLAEPYALVLIEGDIRVMGDPDDSIAHGILSLRALIDQ